MEYVNIMEAARRGPRERQNDPALDSCGETPCSLPAPEPM